MQRYRSAPYAAVMLWAGIVLLGCPQTNVPDPRPKADFRADVVDGNSPLTVQFTDLSSPGASTIESWYWDFGDDGGAWSTQQNPLHTFMVPAGEELKDFAVSLTVTSARGSSTKTVEGYITVRQPATNKQTTSGTSVSQLGVTITFPKNLPEQEGSTIGVSLGSLSGTLNATEPLKIVSDVFTIRHTRASEAFYAFDESGYILPTTIEIPISSQALSGATLSGQSVFIMAILANGLHIPILGEVQNDKVVASAIRLPNRADYVAVYRAGAYDTSVGFYGGAISFTGNEAENRWRVNFSPLMLQQLTALRLGTIADPSGFDTTDFPQNELDLTESIVLSSVDDVRNQFVDARMRAPLLAASKNTFSLVFYNIGSSYTPDYARFQDLVYADRSFGQIVIDPMQLLSICRHNAMAAANDIGAQDLDQKMTFQGPLAEQLSLAVFDAYEYPEITKTGPADLDQYGTPRPVHALAGLRDGTATYLSQWAEGVGYARGFGDNEYARLSQPLFAALHLQTSRYAVASQEFLAFVRNAYAPRAPLAYVLADGSNGLFFAVRKAIQDEQDRRASGLNPVPISFDEVLPLVYQATGSVLSSRFGSSLPEAYWRLVRERAVEHPAAALLRPSDQDLVRYVLDERHFEPGSLVKREIQNTGSTVLIAPSAYPAFGGIPAFSARAVELTVDPRATRLELTFNSSEWAEDGEGNGVAVAVYKRGEALVDYLGSGDSTLIVPGLPGNENAAAPEIIVLVANLNASSANSVRISATALGEPSSSLDMALYDYAHTPDPEYTYGPPAASYNQPYNSTVYWTDMTSGSWRGAEVGESRRLWRHKLGIVRPPVIGSTTALLMITGGSTGSLPDEEVSYLMLPFALSSGTVTAVLGSVPNEPLMFNNDGRQRTEDGIIAYSYAKYLQTGDTTWPALFPMVRAAVRAMDTIQQQMLDIAGVNIERFVVMGASKRGWTTWLTGASDSRVCGVAPLVINILNMKPQIEHHYFSYGDFSEAIEDYWENQIIHVPPVFNTLMERNLLTLVDPYSYLSVLDMPKFTINSTGDQFFLPDAPQFYFDDLIGEKYNYYAPNTDHGLTSNGAIDPGVIESLYSFYSTVVRGVQRPTITWEYDPINAGRIRVETSVKAKEVRLWQATNPDRRDFRLDPLNITVPIPPDAVAPAWSSVAVTSDTNEYIAQVPIPASGWTAYYVEAAFANFGQLVNIYAYPNRIQQTDFLCTTECRVIPDTYPQ